jgi:cysteine desulfuration protein SufE
MPGFRVMDLAEKQRQLIADLAALKDGQDRLALLMQKAKVRPALPVEQRVPDNLVPGCLAKLWFVACDRDGLCFFACDSDSLVVKAIAGLLCEFYSGQPPAEILARDPQFLVPLGINQHLTPNRRNALARVWERIRQAAEASRKPA